MIDPHVQKLSFFCSLSLSLSPLSALRSCSGSLSSLSLALARSLSLSPPSLALYPYIYIYIYIYIIFFRSYSIAGIYSFSSTLTLLHTSAQRSLAGEPNLSSNRITEYAATKEDGGREGAMRERERGREKEKKKRTAASTSQKAVGGRGREG